jgi:dipeptidyl aminopeptidase/acylaminoacyl peptidase
MHRPGTKTLRALLLATLLALAALTLPASSSMAQEAPGNLQAPTLEQLFPKNGLIGAPATQVAFSHDGKYAAYVHYRDLWIVDTTANTQFKAVSAQTLAKFRSADRDTPKNYYGVFHYTWSPQGSELLFLCEGHLYRYQLPAKEITRLTKVRMSSWEAPWFETLRYLPDGSGYLFARGGYESHLSIWKGTFATKAFQPWVPRLPAGEALLNFEISPDGQHLAMRTRKTAPGMAWSFFKIATYRDRFMQVQTTARFLADDALLDSTFNVFVAPLDRVTTDANAVTRVWSYKQTAHGDIATGPSWSPDSLKLALARYAHTQNTFEILETELQSDRNLRQGGNLVPQKARVVHAFEHMGGPTTPKMLQPWYLADSRHLVFVCEQSEFLQLHKLDTQAGTFTQLTSGQFEVYPIALAKDRSAVYVATTKDHPTQRVLYSINVTNGNMQRLTAEPGTYGDIDRNWNRITTVAVSPDGQTVLANYATFGKLRELVQVDVAAGTQKALTISHGPQAHRLATARPEFISYKNRHGDTIYGYAFKPQGWQKTDQRPALIYIYGGALGIDKEAMDGEVREYYLFAQYMAEKHGYLTVVLDPRGASGYGGRHEKANFEQPGKAQVEDLEDGAKFLVANYGVDAKRIGLHGWSFGGFATQMCLYTSDAFAAGIAGAGPTQWENYNAWYTTTAIGKGGPPRRTLRRFSLLPLAKDLQGQLLLVHGMEDNNVLLQDTINVYRALLDAGKVTQVELFLDPTGGHGLGGDVQQLGKFRKYEQFLLRTLGSGNHNALAVR